MKNICRTEPLDEAELAFIEKKYEKESKAYMSSMNLVLKGSVLFPCLTGGIYFFKYQRIQLMWKAYLFAQIICIILAAIIGVAAFMKNLFALRKDVKQKTKTIESCLIASKKYMPQNNSFHFYLMSPTKYSIEVSETDFHQFNVNDEINIEYTTNSEVYFGYF